MTGLKKIMHRKFTAITSDMPEIEEHAKRLMIQKRLNKFLY